MALLEEHTESTGRGFSKARFPNGYDHFCLLLMWKEERLSRSREGISKRLRGFTGAFQVTISNNIPSALDGFV
jgi:hypothetical protein